MAVSTSTLVVSDGTGVNRNMTTLADPAGAQRTVTSPDEAGAAVYRASATFTPQATAAVTLITFTGSATKTCRIRRILLGGHSTANAETTIALQRTTALGAGGTAVPPNVAKVDSGTVAAATGAVNHYTATLKAAGTATGVGPLTTTEFFTGVITTPTVTTGMQQIWPDLGSPIGQALVVRGVGDFIEIQNTNAGNLSTATVLSYAIEWIEDGS